jgi:serine/threonine protein kinase
MTRLEFKQRLSIAIGAAKGDKIAKSRHHPFTPVMHNARTPPAQGVRSKKTIMVVPQLSLSLATAGLSHLHSLAPPLIHRDFKTSNVLVDENFIAKVSDAGIHRLLRGPDGGAVAAPASRGVFQDPE